MIVVCFFDIFLFFFSSRRRHTRCALVTGVQTCALPIYRSIQNYDDNTLNVCLPATYRFVDTVVDALAAMHSEAGVPLRTFHLGADETAGAWVKSPACQTMIAENGGDAGKLTPRDRKSTRLNSSH